ncbi:ead/Ea22-like family protein [Klebsiella variicola]
MTTDITELAQRMKAAAEKATPGEWWADEVKNEGCYGPGDDCVEGFTSYAIYGSDGQTLFDSLNSDAACISEEYDGEGHVAWDEAAQRNAEFIALANPANILALVKALEKAQQRISQLESRTVKLPKPKNSDQGWKIDPEFINKVQDAIGYDDTCECWEGTPSMELVEAVLLAAAGIKVEAE